MAGTTTVINLKGRKSKALEEGEVYIGRPINMGGWRLKGSEWANPFKPSDEEPLSEVLGRYEDHLRTKGLMTEEKLRPLIGKKLCCWCAPEPCHGDVIRCLCWRLEQIDAGSDMKLDDHVLCPADTDTIPPLGLVACDKLPGMRERKAGEGSWPEIPGYYRFNCSSSGGGWLKHLSPFYVGPFCITDFDSTGQQRSYRVTCLENLWQATKVEAKYQGYVHEDGSRDRPKKFWFTRRDTIWRDGKAHRHVVAKADRCAPEEALHYWQGKYISYEQARKEIYIAFYFAALTNSATPSMCDPCICGGPDALESYARLENMVDRGHNLLIIGPDGRDVQDLEAEFKDLSKPFGHELVLVSMLSDQRWLYNLIASMDAEAAKASVRD